MATIDLTSSTLVASFPGLNRANGTDQLDLVATLVDTAGAPLEGSTVEFMVSPVFRADVVGATAEGPAGTYTAAFTTSDASIKKVSLLVDGVEVGLTAQAEFVEFDDSFLVDDPFTENVGQLSSDLTLSGQQITLNAEANNSGAITEIIWNGQQLLNVLNKDRGLQTKVVKDNFGETNWAQLNEAGALRQSWADTSSSRYIGDAQDLRSLVTQTFLSYREPVNFNGLDLDCSGDILTKHIGMDYLGNPNIFRIDFQNDQYASSKIGTTSWAVSLGLQQNFTRFYTFAPSETVTEPTEQALNSGVEVLNTTYMGGPIVASEDGNVALGIFRTVRAPGAELLSSFVRPQAPAAGAPKFTENYCQLIDFEDTAASGGMSAGKHRMERFICVGSLQAVTNAFRELQYFLTTGMQNPGDPGEPPPPPTQTVDSIYVTAAPATVTRNSPFSVSVRAVDFAGATVTDYNGTVTVTAPSSLGLTTSSGTTVNFSNGEATFPDLALTGSGSGDLVFTTQTNLGPRTGVHTIGIENAVPTISLLTPNTAADNLPGVEIRVDGTGLVNGVSTVRWGGTNLATVFNDGGTGPDYLTATVPAGNLVQSPNPYSVSVFNSAPGGGFSNSLPFTVTDGTPPVVLSSSVSSSGTSATLTWSTNESSFTNVVYGPLGSANTEEVLKLDNFGEPLFDVSHQVMLTGLNSETTYVATIITQDGAGNRNAAAATLQWDTDDTIAPTITGVNVEVLGSTNATITVSVDESSTVTLSIPGVPTQAPRAASPSSPAVFSLGGLAGGTTYTYTIIATDSAGNQSDAASGSFTTQVAADTTPPAFVELPTVQINGLTATISWVMDEISTGAVYYRIQGETGGFTVANSSQTNTAHIVNALLPFYETVYEFYVAGQDLATIPNAYQSDTFTFASGPDPTGPGGGLDPSEGDLVVGQNLTRLRVNVPAGLSVGDTFIAQATVPVARPTDLNLNWAVDGQVVQRHVSSYKPRAQASSARYVHQLLDGQVTHPASQWQTAAGTLPDAWSTGATAGSLEFDTATGGQAADEANIIRYYSDLVEPGTYELKLRGSAAYIPDEFFYVRINGGPWQQAHGSSSGFGGYVDANESAFINFMVEAATVGEYLIEIGGASDTMDLERIAIVPAGETPQTAVDSELLLVQADPTGPNSAEIAFPVTVPAGLGTIPDPQAPVDAQFFEVDLVATDAPLPGGTAQAGREVDQMKLVMMMPKAAQDNPAYDSFMDANIAGGAGTTLKSGPYMDEVVYYTRLTDASGNAGVGVHTYVRYFKADVDDSVYVDLNITNSHVDTTRIVSGMSENAYIGNPGKIFFDQLYLETNDVNYNIINGFGAETVTTPNGTAMTVGDPYCGGPALGDDTTFFFVDYTDDPENEPTRSHDGTGGIPARSEVFHAGAQRIEQVVLRPASSPVKSDDFATAVSQYQNLGRTVIANASRNAAQELRWWGGNYYRSGELPETYVAQSPFPATLTGSDAYDRMRMNNAGQAIKEILSTGAIQSNRDFFEQGGIVDWADMTQFGCWTPGGSVDGSSSKNHMLNVYENAAGPGHTRGWAFFARTVLQRHSITAFDSTGAPITIRHLYGTSAQAGATANESAIQVRNDRSGQAHGWSFFYERDEWVADRFYSRGTQVRYNGEDFVCILSHRAVSTPSIGSFWAAGSEDNTRANQREFNGSYPIVPADQIDVGDPYTPTDIITCAYDTAWDQFTPISRDYIQRLYRCFLGLRLTVNPGIFNDYQRYQTELYLAAEDRFITQDVLNGGKTNDTLGHCLATFQGQNANRGFFTPRTENPTFSDPGMQSEWGAGKAWAHWVIAQGMFFTAPEEVYPAPVLGGEQYNRRQHIREHLMGVRDLIAAVMPGESSGNITESYPATAAKRRSYLNDRDLQSFDEGLEDTQLIGYTVNFPTNGGAWTIEEMKAFLSTGDLEDENDPNNYRVISYNASLSYPDNFVGYLVGVDQASVNDATVWIYRPADAGLVPTQGNVLFIGDYQSNKIPQQYGYLLQVGGLEADLKEFTFSRTSDQQINVHMWQCLAESLNGFDAGAAEDMYRLTVDYAQYDLEKTGDLNQRVNWDTSVEVGGAGDGTFAEWTGLIAGTSTTYAGGYYPFTADVIPEARNQVNFGVPSTIVPRNVFSPSDGRQARDGQDENRLPAVTGQFVPKVSSEWANLAWLAAHYSTRRLGATSDPVGLSSPYLLNSYLRTGLGYELEPFSPFLAYDASGNILNTINEAQRVLINAFDDVEERFAAKSRVLAGYYAKSLAYENWYNSSPIFAEVDYELRSSGVTGAGIRFIYANDPNSEYEQPLELDFTPGTATVNQAVILANNGVATSSNTVVTFELLPDPEGPVGGFMGVDRLELVTTSMVVPANTGTFSAPVQLRINRNAANDFYGSATQGALLRATATGAIEEVIQMPITLEYPTLDPSVVRFPSAGAPIQDGSQVVVQVSRTNTQVPVSVEILGVGDPGFTVSGLTNNRLEMSAGVPSATFTVAYSQPQGQNPGAFVLTIQDDTEGFYTVDPTRSTFTITALTPVEGGDSEVAVARLGAGDGAAAPTQAALEFSADSQTLVSVMVPVMPSQASAPIYSMALGGGTEYLADVFPVGRDKDGINLVQVTCPVDAVSDGRVRHSIPNDAANPTVLLRRKGPGDTVPPAAPATLQGGESFALELAVPGGGDPYRFSLSEAQSRVIYSGNYTEQVEYYGRFKQAFTNAELLVARVIVTRRSDISASTVDVVVENSAVSCGEGITDTDADNPNVAADGTVYFDSLKVTGAGFTPPPANSFVSGTPHPSQGDYNGDYCLVKPFSVMYPSGSGRHGILPGQWFVRRFATRLASGPNANDINLAISAVNRDDWGFVEGGLGYVQGGFGVAGEGLPLYSRIAGLSFNGEEGFRAAKERSDVDRAAAITDFTGANMPATTFLGSGSTQWPSWGWFKGTGDASTLKNPAAVKPYGVNVPSWRAGTELLIQLDRTIERSGFAVFNVDTGYPLRDSEYRVGGQVPAAFNLFRNPALDVNPWLWTNTTLPGSSASANWARAQASKQAPGDQACQYLDNPGMVNWHLNTANLSDPTDVSQTDRDPDYGPFRGSASSRTLQAYVPAIYLLNDRVAKILCEYDATRAMFGFGRYQQRGGGISTSRSPFGAAQATFGLYFLATDPNSPYAGGNTNTGIILRRQSNSITTAEIPGTEAWAGPAQAVATAYHVGDSNTRAWVAPATDRNWFTLMDSVLQGIASVNGVVGANLLNTVELGLPRYSDDVSDVPTISGALPGPQAGNGVITPVTAPTGLAYQTPVQGTVELTWEYPDEPEYPSPTQFVVIRDGADVATGINGLDRAYTDTGVSFSETVTYQVRAEYDDGSTVQTATSAELTDVLADGSDGTINQPSYDGEDLPVAGYYVPDTIFDYLIDLSDDNVTGTNALKTAALQFNQRSDPAITLPGSASWIELADREDAEPTRIAVLLPARSETDTVTVSRTGTASDKAQFNALNTNIELHFVAPWAASIEDRATAASESRADTASYSYSYTADATTSGNDIEFDGVYENAKHEIHLWNWDITLDNPMKLGRTAASTTNINQVSQQSDVYIHMSKITGSAGIDVELTRLQLEGVYIDLPGATGSAITMDAVPYGNMTWQRVDILNSGGAAIQVRNTNAIDAITDLRSRVQSGSPGTILFTEWSSTQFEGDTPFAMFSFEGDHHAIEFGNHANFIVKAPSPGAATAPVLSVANDALGATNAFGGYCSGVSVTGSNVGFYSEDPTGPVIQIDAAREIQLGGRISVGTGATNDTVHIGTAGRGGLESSANIFDSLRFSVEAAGTTTNWLTGYGVTGITDIEGRGGDNLVQLLDGTDAPLYANENIYQSFTGPSWDEAANDPYVPGGTFDALALYQAGTSRIDAKTAVVPNMKAGRAPRFVETGGFDIKKWRVDAGEPNGVYTEITGNQDRIDVSADGTVITFSNFYNDGSNMNPGQQKILFAQYADRSQSEIINGESVLSRQFYERPVGAKVVFDNLQVEDLSTRYYSPPYSYIDNGLNLDNATDVPRLAAGINATQTDIQLDDWTWRLVNTNADMFPYVCLAENKGSVQSTTQQQEIILVGSFDETNQRLLNCTRGVQFDNPVPEWGVLGGPAKSWPAATQVFGAPNPLNRSLKWGGRMNAMPNLHIKDCDFKTVHEEHTCYGNSEGPILIENTTFQNATAQGTQWVHRTTENPYQENHAYDPNDPPTREVRNSHFIDCGAYGTVTGRKSSNLTFQDSGYPALPCPYVKITDCSFVTGIEAFEPVASDGDGGGGSGYRYRYTKDGGIYQSSGVIQIGVEGGWFRNPHLYNNVDMQPIAQARTDDSAAIHQLIQFKNTYIHALDPDKAVVRLQGGRNIIIEDTVIILEWREGGSAKPCLIIDTNMWKAVTERGTVNHHYMFSQKLILRNSVIEVHDYRGGGSTPIITPGNIQFSNGFYLGDGYQQRLNSAQLDDYANTLGREVEFAGYYADGQQRTTGQVEVPIYDGPIRPGYVPT